MNMTDDTDSQLCYSYGKKTKQTQNKQRHGSKKEIIKKRQKMHTCYHLTSLFNVFFKF